MVILILKLGINLFSARGMLLVVITEDQMDWRPQTSELEFFQERIEVNGYD